MTTLFEDALNSGANAATLTTANSKFTSVVTPSIATFDTSKSVIGDRCLKYAEVGTSGYGQFLNPGGLISTLFVRLYFFPHTAVPVTLQPIFAFFATATIRAQLVVTTGGFIAIRNGTTAIFTGTTNICTTPAWWRYDLAITSTTLSLKSYTGANLHGTTTSAADSGSGTYNQGTFDTLRMGAQAANTNTYWFQGLTMDDAVDPGPWPYSNRQLVAGRVSTRMDAVTRASRW